MISYKDYWIEKSNLLNWDIKPKKSLLKKKNNKNIWYPDGRLNLYENCITRHLNKKKTALFCIDKKKKIKQYTYKELNNLVNSFCIYLTSLNFKINNVIIHSSASLISAVSMLAFSKMGIHFSVIFEDLSFEAIETRIKLLKPNLLISTSHDEIIKKIEKSIKLNKSGKDYFIISSKKNLFESNKIKYFDFYKDKNNFQNFESKLVPSSNPLFTLFTSGSTGEPKGITHSTGGYLVYSLYTCLKQFGMNKNSVILTASDAGWINGHTYALFGPLGLGATSILLEKPIMIIDYVFLEKIIKELKITILYLPVTLIRILKSLVPKNKKINSYNLLTLGSMGEPLANSVAKWFSKLFFNFDKPVVNTYFQTETGGILCSPKFSEKKVLSYGTVGRPVNKFLKINKPTTDNKIFNIKVLNSWPGCMIDILNGIQQWNKYWDKDKFKLYDIGYIDKNKNLVISGRSDDVINIRGHRIGSGEVESILLKIDFIKEISAISIHNDLEGSNFVIFLSVKNKISLRNIIKKINLTIIKYFGSYALPEKIIFVKELPKTKSGKILRRVLRVLYEYEDVSKVKNISTINNKNIINNLISEIKRQKN